MIITSATNEKIKNVIKLKDKAKARKEAGLFVVEGINIFVELDKGSVEEVFVSESFADKYMSDDSEYDNIRQLATGQLSYQLVSDKVMTKMSDTVTPQGIIALVRMQDTSVESVLKNVGDKSTVLVLDRLQDPGNMGTIIRTAEAAGVDLIVASADSVDVYNPKVTRATMGGILRMPIVVSANITDVIKTLQDNEYTAYAAHLKGEDITNYKLADKRVFLIGNESKGLSDEVSNMADELIKIPMQGQIESLNAAVAAAILMYQK